MLKSIVVTFLSIMTVLPGSAQKLTSFTATLNPRVGVNSYLSITQKKVFTAEEAKSNKSSVDLALIITQNDKKQVAEWYNLSGKDEKIPADLRGTASVISTLSFDKDQFDKCNTSQDLQRMTGYLTKNSFVHFASITDDLAAGIKYHCFLVQMENGKRALLWLEATDAKTFKASVKL